jgi:hypothetical protein
MAKGAAHSRHEHHQRRGKPHIEIHGVDKRRRRQRAQQNVAGDAAADGCDKAQYADTQNIHIFPYGGGGATDGKGHCAKQLQNKGQLFHGRCPPSVEINSLHSIGKRQKKSTIRRNFP